MSRILIIGNLLLIACGATALRLPIVPPATVPITRLQLVAESGPDGAGGRSFLRPDHSQDIPPLAITDIVRKGLQP